MVDKRSTVGSGKNMPILFSSRRSLVAPLLKHSVATRNGPSTVRCDRRLAHPEASGCEAGGMGRRSSSLSAVGATHRTKECNGRLIFDVLESLSAEQNLSDEQAQDANGQHFFQLGDELLYRCVEHQGSHKASMGN